MEVAYEDVEKKSPFLTFDDNALAYFVTHSLFSQTSKNTRARIATSFVSITAFDTFAQRIPDSPHDAKCRGVGELVCRLVDGIVP